jgi:hypothetical protein
MRLSKEALLEIVALVQDGIFNSRDISDNLRQLDLVPQDETGGVPDEWHDDCRLALAQAYLASHPRAATWAEQPQAKS